jgi:hypothetical protein
VTRSSNKANVDPRSRPVSLGLDCREPADCRPPAQAFSHASTESTDPDKSIAAVRRGYQAADQQELHKNPASP